MVTIENGFAEVETGRWLMSSRQPVAFFGSATRLRRKGWWLRDRAYLELVETTGRAKCADATRPFLTHIPCAARVSALSEKVLLAPEQAWCGAATVKPIPMSIRGALCVTEFAQPIRPSDHPAWVVLATHSRTARVALEDGDTLSVRPEAAVAWTGRAPTGYCPRLRVWDILLPRAPRNLLLTFYGPGVVWVEGSHSPTLSLSHSPTLSLSHSFPRRAYGI